jgi:hypothetical protein
MIIVLILSIFAILNSQNWSVVRIVSSHTVPNFWPCTPFFYNFCLGKSGYVKSRYCIHPAKFCFGSGQVVHVPFNPPFQRAPKVMIGLTLVDTHKDQNVRVRASVENVTSTGFKIRFSPWDVSITYQLGVNWMACP